MARTYTVHGHLKRRDGRQEAFWTRTGLSKSEADKLAKEQRRETGGVAKVVAEESAVPLYGPKKTPAQLDREIAESLSRAGHKHGGTWSKVEELPSELRMDAPSRRRSHATKSAGEVKAEELDRQIAPGLGKSRAQIVRAINSIVRAADGRNVYLLRERLGSGEVRRVTRARTKGRGMEVYLLDSGHWLGVLPEMGDRIDVR